MQQLTALRQICSGFLVTDVETKEAKFIDDTKYKLLIAILKKKLYNKKVIILCNFYNEIDTIEQYLEKHNITSFKRITGAMT